MRGHVPATEETGDAFAPVYKETKARIEAVFGARSDRFWPENDQTCSKCYSVAPAVAS
jgi:hypothetical protein